MQNRFEIDQNEIIDMQNLDRISVGLEFLAAWDSPRQARHRHHGEVYTSLFCTIVPVDA
jgi:hypothetical protein